jgi:hypothetical protein
LLETELEFRWVQSSAGSEASGQVLVSYRRQYFIYVT